MILNLKHQVEQGWEYLLVEPKLLVEGKNGERSIFQEFLLDSQDMLFVDRDHLVDSRAEGFDIDSVKLITLDVVVIPSILLNILILSLLLLASSLVVSIGQLQRQLVTESAISVKELLNQLKLVTKGDYLVDHLHLGSCEDGLALVNLTKVAVRAERWVDYKPIVLKYDDISSDAKKCV